MLLCIFLVLPAAAYGQGNEQAPGIEKIEPLTLTNDSGVVPRVDKHFLEKRRQLRQEMAQRDYSSELIVKWDDVVPTKEREMLLQQFGLQTVHEHGGLSLINIKGQAQQEIINKLQQSGRVEFVEPNMPVELYYVPNDPFFPEQWWLHKISAPMAWDNLVPNKVPVTVAVVDSGIDFYHEDLAGRIDLVRAWDFVFNDDFPYDFDGHGTLIAGVIAAATDNHIGIAGTCGKLDVKILPLNVFDSIGASTYLISQAIIYAVDVGADVINLSLGGSKYSNIIAYAVNYAYESDVSVVAAAGNDGGPVSYPAALPHVIAVTASDRDDRVTAFSNIGPEVTAAAPGVEVLSTDTWYPGYKVFSGTSAAAPIVSAGAAIVKTQLPGATADEVRSIICQGVKDIGPPGRDDYSGFGRIDLDLISAQLVDSDKTEPDLYIAPGQLLQIVFNQKVSIKRNPVSFFHIIDAEGRGIPVNLYFIGNVSEGETGGYTTFWLQPSESWNSGQTYKLQIDAGLKAVSGQVLSKGFSQNIRVYGSSGGGGGSGGVVVTGSAVGNISE